jgi:nucleoside 2-deoxyribosyltransferase
MRIYFAAPLFTPYERAYIDECTTRLRAEGHTVFVPHEETLDLPDRTPDGIFAKDREGVEQAEAMLAVLDGLLVDDGTACEIGIFHALMQTDPSRKGIVGLLTDLRSERSGQRLNLFVEGCITASNGSIVSTIDDAVAALAAMA